MYYQVFVYKGEANRWRGNVDSVQEVDRMPKVGDYVDSDNDNWYITGVYDSIGIIDVVIEQRKK